MGLDLEHFDDDAQLQCFNPETTAAAAAVATSESLKPFAAFGSYRQRHGDDDEATIRGGLSSEAPAKLGSSEARGSEFVRSSSMPLNIPQPSTTRNEMRRKATLRSSRSSRSDHERDRAWEQRKREQQKREEQEELIKQQQENQQQEEISRARAVGRSVSDCGERAPPRLIGKSVLRTRSLTDEDLDELRGSIDLGFGFSNQADSQLWNTLPALELCYAINQQYQSRASPSSTLDDDGTTMSDLGSSSSPVGSPSWAISSPGDNPQQVRTRIRHWAQAVACTVQQTFC